MSQFRLIIRTHSAIRDGGVGLLLLVLTEFGIQVVKYRLLAKACDRNRQPGKKDRTYAAVLIVGADGTGSSVRGALMKQPRFNFSQEFIDSGYKEVHIPATQDGLPQLNIDALHIWPRQEFMLMGLANMDNGFTGTVFAPFDGALRSFALELSSGFKTWAQQELRARPVR